MDTSLETHGEAPATITAEPCAQVFGRSAAEGGDVQLSRVEDLLVRAPIDLTTWLLDQLTLLSRSDTNVQEVEIFDIARNFSRLSMDQKQALVNKTICGFNQLPPERCTEVLRLAMQSVDVTSAWQRRVVDGTSLENNADAMTSVSSESSTPFVENVLEVVQAAQLQHMSPEELESIMVGARSEALRQVEIPQIFQALTQLEQDERAQLADSLLSAQVLSDDHRSLLNEAIRSGGTVDKVAPVLKFIKMVKSRMWFICSVPLCELLVAMTMGAGPGPALQCSTELAKWLRGDAMIALSLAFSTCVAGKAVEPVYSKLRADPVGSMERWRESVERPLCARLLFAIPGTSVEDFQASGLIVSWCFVLLVSGMIYAVDGLLELVAALALGCHELMLFVSFLFIGLRVSMIAALVVFVISLRKNRWSLIGEDSDDDRTL